MKMRESKMLEKKMLHTFPELNTHVVDKALFGQEDKLIAVISWIDMYKSNLQRTPEGAIEFIKKYFVPEAKEEDITDVLMILDNKTMKHKYDNAFRVELRKQPRDYDIQELLKYQSRYMGDIYA